MNQQEANQLVADALKTGMFAADLGGGVGFHSVWLGRDLTGPEKVFVIFDDASSLSVTVEILAQP